MRKPVLEVSDKVRLKPIYSAIENSYSSNVLYQASLYIILCIERKQRRSDCADVQAGQCLCSFACNNVRFSHYEAQISLDASLM